MPIFIQDLIEFDYLRLTVAAIILASVASGIVGGYVVAQRQSYMIGAVSHSLLGGVGLARFLQTAHGFFWFTPIIGALVAAVTAATAITTLTQKTKARTDAVLSAVWTLGVALGVSFIAITPGYAEDLNSYLFGSILLVAPTDLKVMVALDILIALAAYLLHNRFLAFCFLPENLRLRGLSPFATALALNTLVALTVVLLAQVVGIVLVLVMLVLPAAIASFVAKRLTSIMAISGTICLLVSLLGLLFSYQYDWPVGATIVEFTVGLFLLANVLKTIRHKMQGGDRPEPAAKGEGTGRTAPQRPREQEEPWPPKSTELQTISHAQHNKSLQTSFNGCSENSGSQDAENYPVK